MTFSSIRRSRFSKIISTFLTAAFIATMIITPRVSYAQEGLLGLPKPGTMVNLSPAYIPLMITGLTVHPENPLLMDFIVSTGNSEMTEEQVKYESDRLIKYFLACLTIPENNQWVNLSPYEKERIVPRDLGETVLGRDMLAQDYLLKQLTASLIYPEKNLGKNFWDKVYAKANEMYGTTQIPVNTFNKVWILPDTAKVYEHKDTVFVVKSHLKVMLDEDYLALSKHADVNSSEINTSPADKSQINNVGNQIVRQIILPAVEEEVNTGKNFAQLRQIYNSMILSVWFKKNLKEALLNQVYTDKSKINGVNVDDPGIKEKIYKQYLQAYRKGVFNYIREEDDPTTQEIIPRKYFSGGLVGIDKAMLSEATPEEAREAAMKVPGDNTNYIVRGLTQDTAMSSSPGAWQVTADSKNQNPERRELKVKKDGMEKLIGVVLETRMTKIDNVSPDVPVVYARIGDRNIFSLDHPISPEELPIISAGDIIKALGKHLDTVETADRAMIGKPSQDFENILSEKVSSAKERMRSLLDAYYAAKAAGQADEAKRLDGAINKIVDELNVFRQSKPEDLILSDDVESLSSFKSSPEFGEDQRLATNTFLDGNYVPQFIFAGAATRLNRGPMYSLDIWDIAVELGKAKSEDVRYRMGMGPRQIVAYRSALEALAKQNGVSPQEALSKQKIIVNINADIEQIVLEDFIKNDFYGFRPENVYFITQPTFHGYKYQNGNLVFDPQSPTVPYGHGHNFMQLGENAQAFTLDVNGNRHYLQGSILNQFSNSTLIGSHRINDLTKLSSDSVISVDKLAFAIDQFAHGFDVVGELVDNPNKQKGGNVLKDTKTGKSFLIETSNVKGDSGLVKLLDEAGTIGAPYNAFRLVYKVGSLKNILQKSLPFNLRFKDGYFYLEAVTGDVTQMPETKAKFMSSGEQIHDFKEPKNVDDALQYLRQSDSQLASGDAAMTAVSQHQVEISERNIEANLPDVRKLPGQSTSKAALPENGGIDLNARNLKMLSEGEKVNIIFNPAMIAQFKRGDFSGVRIQILNVAPVNLMPLLGLKEDEEPGAAIG